MKIVGIIPARGGSERVPNKNLRMLNGKPLIAWTILTAKKSKKLDRVIVSTDSPKIGRIAKQYGAEVPFMRPAEHATSTVGVEPTLRHAYEWLEKEEGYSPDGIALIFGTNPLRQVRHIDDAINIFKKKKVDSVVSVNETPANHTPYWTLIRSKKGKVTLWGDIPLKKILTRRQDFPQQCYARNDLIYVLKPKNLYDKVSNLYGDTVELMIIPDPEKYEVDINTPADWQEAEKKLKKLSKR